MLGTIVNGVAILIGGILGLFFRGRVIDRYNETVMQGVGLAVILIGLKSAFASDDLLLIIISLAVGGLLGEFFGIEARLEQMGNWLEKKFSKNGSGISKGFVTASLIFCVGSMAIVGSMESGLTGNHTTLYAKSLLDGITSVVFAATMGLGVLFSSASVLIYQGAITLTASVMKQFLLPEVVAQMTSVGGLLILSIGVNILGMAKIKIGNLLPGIFIPLIYYIIRQMFS